MHILFREQFILHNTEVNYVLNGELVNITQGSNVITTTSSNAGSVTAHYQSTDISSSKAVCADD